MQKEAYRDSFNDNPTFIIEQPNSRYRLIVKMGECPKRRQARIRWAGGHGAIARNRVKEHLR
jgi:hypothetical protein